MAAFGFHPVRYMNGSPWNGAVVRHSVLSAVANVFIGDMVDIAGTASISPLDGAILMDCGLAVAGSPNYGVITGVNPGVGTPNLNITYGATGAYREIWVCPVEPTLILECTANSALTTAALGLSYDLVATAGVASTGISAQVLNSTPAAANGGGFQFWNVRSDPSNLNTLTAAGTTITIMSAAQPTIIEVLCVEPRIGLSLATLGV